tara:strand:- start:133 stop:582 length:450 start_codon:yes stop_codon:yes gene_type:complete
MKYSEKIIKQLNDLLIMNYEVEIIYVEAMENVNNNELKTFFRERGFERNEFGKELRDEIEKLEGNPEFLGELSSDFYKIRMNFRNFLLLENKSDLLSEVYKIKQLTIKAYNDLLMELNLPLSLCKLLEKHRNQTKENLNVMKREEAFVA